MNLPLARASLARTASAAVLASAAFAAVLPGVANAVPGDRSVLATVRNDSSVRLNLMESDVAEGRWTTEPPTAIKSFKTARFGSMSAEDEGGTEATVVYRSRFGDVEIYWDHPWVRDSQITCIPPDELMCDTVVTGSAKSKVTFTLSDAA
ncbi:hypothetical protein [Actinoplanes aureus]|uniref:Secreted protein n=1 Tax=Actinoplanes aureus TaxID=2792083 RepID=A0A931C6W6_9ACTN|nr:hypothetical protein [Actinoplanes aureus]MBG0564515.1 hypothetical protein [Actinoplanes aureus]